MNKHSLFLVPSVTVYMRSEKAMSTGGLLGRWLRVLGWHGVIVTLTAPDFLSTDTGSIIKRPPCLTVDSSSMGTTMDSSIMVMMNYRCSGNRMKTFTRGLFDSTDIYIYKYICIYISNSCTDISFRFPYGLNSTRMKNRF